MEKEPLISIVLPVYNGSNYLEKAINSVLNQSYKNYELIIINDGSDDEGKTEKIALQNSSEKIVYFKQENGGVSSALNRGIKISKGDYICWLSHDDEFLPDKLSSQVELFNSRNKIDFIYGDYFFSNDNSEIIGECLCPKESKYIVSDMFQAMFICGSTIMFKKECVENNNLFNEDLKYTQDAEFWIRNIFKNYNFVHINKKLSKVRIHQSQGSNNKRMMKKGTFAYLDIFLNTANPKDFFPEVNFGDKRNLSMFYIYLSRILLLRHKYYKKSFFYLKQSFNFNKNHFLLFFKIIFYIFIYEFYSLIPVKSNIYQKLDFRKWCRTVLFPSFYE